MSSTYAGSPVYPVDFPIPDDADPPTAGAFNPAIEALGNRTAFLKATSALPVILEFFANATITIPADALPWVLYEGCGGGGAGGQGGGNIDVGGAYNAGGGGGGGAVFCHGTAPVVPGESYALAIGAGGAGAGLFGLGLPGGDTTLTRVAGGTVVLICHGAGGGHSGVLNGAVTVASGNFNFARGGPPVRITVGALLTDFVCEPAPYATMHLSQVPQGGGLGVSANWTPGVAQAGRDSPQGQSGGTGGTLGATVGSYQGGGGAGGGGAGPFGPGGNGGNGTTGVATYSASSPGTPGASAAANSGAGGGGGGGAGACPITAAALGGSPGAGGSGRLRIIYFRRAVP